MDMHDGWEQLSEIAAGQHGAFLRDQAIEVGVSARRLSAAFRAGRLRRPMSDVFTFVAQPEEWRQRLKVLDLVGATISGRSAAALNRFDGFAEGKLEVVIAGPTRRRFPRSVESASGILGPGLRSGG